MANRMRTTANARDESDQWRLRDSWLRSGPSQQSSLAAKIADRQTGESSGGERGSNTQNILHSIISVFIAPQRTRKGEGGEEGDGTESEQVYIQMRACTILRSWHWTWRRSGNGSQMRFILT